MAEIDATKVNMTTYSRFINEPIEVVERAYARNPEAFGWETYKAIARAKGFEPNPYAKGTIQHDLFASGLSEDKISQYVDPDTLEFTVGSPMFTHPALSVYEDAVLSPETTKSKYVVSIHLIRAITANMNLRTRNELEARKEALSGRITFNSVHRSPDPYTFKVSRYRVNYWSTGEYFNTLFQKLDPVDYIKWLMLYPIAGISFNAPVTERIYISRTEKKIERYPENSPMWHLLFSGGIFNSDPAESSVTARMVQTEYDNRPPVKRLVGNDHINWSNADNPGLPSDMGVVLDPDADTQETRQNYLNAILQFKSRIVWKHLQDSVTSGDAILTGDLDTSLEALKHALQLKRHVKNWVNAGKVSITVLYPTQQVVIKNGLPSVQQFPINKRALAQTLYNLPDKFLQNEDPIALYINAIPGEVVSVAQVLTAIAEYAVQTLKTQIVKLAAAAATYADENAEVPAWLEDPSTEQIIKNPFWELDVEKSLASDKTVFKNIADNNMLAFQATPKIREMIAFSNKAIKSIPDTIDMYDRKIPLVSGGYASPSDLSNMGLSKDGGNMLWWILGGTAAAVALTQVAG